MRADRATTGNADRARAERGSATVELALVLPFLLGLVLLVVQAGLVLRDQLLLVGAAREVARAAAIDGTSLTPADLRYPGLDADRMDVIVTSAGRYRTAEVRYRSQIVLPLLRSALPEVGLAASLTMRDEAVAP